MSDPANEKYKKVCDDFSNLAILTKSVMPGEVQLIFTHVSFRKNPLGESVAAFSLAGSLDSPYFVFIDINITFTIYSDKIRLLVSDILIRAAADNLARSKKNGVLDSVQRRPPPAIFDKCGNPQQGDLHGRYPQDLCVLHHEERGGGRRLQWGKGQR